MCKQRSATRNHSRTPYCRKEKGGDSSKSAQIALPREGASSLETFSRRPRPPRFALTLCTMTPFVLYRPVADSLQQQVLAMFPDLPFLTEPPTAKRAPQPFEALVRGERMSISVKLLRKDIGHSPDDEECPSREIRGPPCVQGNFTPRK